MRLAFIRRKPGRALGWEIALVIAVKLVLLYGIWTLWFAHPMPQEERAEKTARVLLNKQ